MPQVNEMSWVFSCLSLVVFLFIYHTMTFFFTMPEFKPFFMSYYKFIYKVI